MGLTLHLHSLQHYYEKVQGLAWWKHNLVRVPKNRISRRVPCIIVRGIWGGSIRVRHTWRVAASTKIGPVPQTLDSLQRLRTFSLASNVTTYVINVDMSSFST